MKINTLYSQNTNPFNDVAYNKPLKKQKTSYDSYNKITHEHTKKNLKDNIRPAQALSFGGSAVSAADNFGKKFINNGFLNKTIGFVYDNEAAYNAIYSLAVAGVLKPMFVLAMPGSEEKDKQIVATKNFLQAFIGSFLGLTIGGGIVKKSVDVIENNLKLIGFDKKGKLGLVNEEKAMDVAKGILVDENEKMQKSFKTKIDFAKNQASDKQGFAKVSTFVENLFKKREIVDFEPSQDAIKQKSAELLNRAKEHLPIFEKNTDFIKDLLDKSSTKTLFTNKDTGLSLMDAYKSCWKNSTGFLTAIGKAKISSLLLPGVMAALFAKRNLEKQKENKQDMQTQAPVVNTLLNSKQFKQEQANLYSAFASNKNNISFKGLTVKPTATDTIINGLAKGVEKLSMTKTGEKGVRLLSGFKKQSARMSDLESVLLTTYWVQNTARSKKIDPDQKLGLNVHTILVTAVSSLAAFLIDSALDGPIDRIKDTYKNCLQEAVDKNDLKQVENVINSKKFIKQITNQNNIEQYAKEVAKNSSATESELKTLARKIFGEIDGIELQNRVKEAQNLVNTANKVKGISNKDSLSAMQKLLKESGFELSEENIKQINKNTDTDSIIKMLSQSINKETVEKTAQLYKKQLSKFKSLTVFTLVVRFLVPVLMVPISGKLKKKVIELTSKKNPQNNKEMKKALA